MLQEASPTSLRLVFDSPCSCYSFSRRLPEGINNLSCAKEFHGEHGHPLWLEHMLPQKHIVCLHELQLALPGCYPAHCTSALRPPSKNAYTTQS